MQVLDALLLAGALAVGALAGFAAARFAGQGARRAAAPGAAGDVPVAGPPGLEIHLVLNVLNRLVIALVADEAAQEGVGALADYLRCAHLLTRRPSADGLQRTVTAYWALSRWFSGAAPEAPTWEQTAPAPDPVRMATLAAPIIDALRTLEGLAVTALAVQVSAGPAGLQARIVARGPGLQVEPGGRALPADWTRQGMEASRVVRP